MIERRLMDDDHFLTNELFSRLKFKKGKNLKSYN